MEVAHQHLAVQPPRGHRAQQRTAERVLVDLVGTPQDLRERCGRSIELHRRHEARREMDAMDAPAALGQLEGARRLLAMKRAEQVAERRRLQTAR